MEVFLNVNDLIKSLAENTNIWPIDMHWFTSMESFGGAHIQQKSELLYFSKELLLSIRIVNCLSSSTSTTKPSVYKSKKCDDKTFKITPKFTF